MKSRLLAALLLLGAQAARADHPLVTEDTGVLGAGRWQLELHGQETHDRSAGLRLRDTHASATLARGVTDRLDLQIDLPCGQIEHEDAARHVTESGVEDVSAAAKWRFYERGGFSTVFKPELRLPTGRDDAGLGTGRVGWAAGLAAAYEWRRLQLIGHGRYTANRNRVGEREALRHASLALLWSASERLRLVLDYGRDTNPDRAELTPARELVYGALYALSNDVDFGLGYVQGRSEPAADRSVRAGIKVRW